MAINIRSTCKDAEVLELSYTAGENKNCISILENSLEIVYEVKFILWPSNSTSMYLLKRNKSLRSHKSLYTKVYNGLIYYC